MRIGSCMLAASLAAFGGIAQAAKPQATGDWIDELPTVDQVVQVIAREFNTSPENDDYTAANMAGTFILLRRIIGYRLDIEGQPSPERYEKLHALAWAYMNAELMIGRGIGHRSVSRPDCNVSRSMDCYRRWFLVDLSNTSHVVAFQERVLPLLLPCERAKEYIAMIHDRVIGAQKMMSPAELLSLPPDLGVGLPANKKVSEGCIPYGGDADGNGLCDGWEAAFRNARANGLKAASFCGTLKIKKATTVDSRSIEVEYAVDEQFPTQEVQFLVYRTAEPKLSGTEQPIGEEKLSIPGGKITTVRQPLRILKGTELRPDPNKPYVIVVAKFGAREASAWFQKHLMAVLVHGYTFRVFLEARNLLMGDSEPGMTAEWLLSNDQVEDWQALMESALELIACYDPATFGFNWRHASANGLASLLSAKGIELYGKVAVAAETAIARHEGDVVDIHFIGHSRGAVVVSQALLEWVRQRATWNAQKPPALKSSYVILTLLDPHPAHNKYSPLEDWSPDVTGSLAYSNYTRFQDDVMDPTVVLPANANVREILVWYQQSTAAELDTPLNLWGMGGKRNFITPYNKSGVPITWRRLTTYGPESMSKGEPVDHSGVVDYYLELIYGRRSPLDPPSSPAKGNCYLPPPLNVR